MLYPLFQPIEQLLAQWKKQLVHWSKRRQWPMKLACWFFRTVWYKPCSYDTKRCTQHYYMRPCCRKQLLELFDEITSLLDTHHMRYWVGCGTLLGALRHQDIIPWDTDMDLYILSEDLPTIAALLQSHITPKRLCYTTSPYYNRVSISTINHNGIDLFVLYPHESEPHRYFRLYGDNQSERFTTYEVPNACLEGTDIAMLAGRQVKIPLHAEALMKMVYGPDWRIPQKYFYTIQHNLGSRAEFYEDIQQPLPQH